MFSECCQSCQKISKKMSKGIEIRQKGLTFLELLKSSESASLRKLQRKY